MLYCVYYNTFRAFGLEKFPFKEWILVDLDFSQLNISMCNASQYTTWVPTDEVCTTFYIIVPLFRGQNIVIAT